MRDAFCLREHVRPTLLHPQHLGNRVVDLALGCRQEHITISFNPLGALVAALQFCPCRTAITPFTDSAHGTCDRKSSDIGLTMMAGLYIQQTGSNRFPAPWAFPATLSGLIMLEVSRGDTIGSQFALRCMFFYGGGRVVDRRRHTKFGRESMPCDTRATCNPVVISDVKAGAAAPASIWCNQVAC